MALVMAFVVLPGLVSLLTPIRPMTFIRRTWGALITGFATGSLFVVLPLLAEAAKDLLEGAGLDREESSKTVDVVVPTTYNFPSTGALLSLCFMFFAGWYIGSPIPFARYPGFLISGLFSFFGSATLALPFLLDLLQLPADLFQLYLAVDVIASRFGTLLAAVHVTTLALLAAFAMAGGIKLRAMRVGPTVGVALGSVAAVIAGSYLYFTYLVPQEYQGYRMFVQMSMRGETVPYEVIEDPSTVTPDLRPIFKQIEESGTLRVCFTRDELPIAFRNADGSLVGYDVELVHRLAGELGTKLEFVRVEPRERLAALEGGICHLSTTMAVTPDRTRRIAFTTSHIRWTAAFLVPDHRRNEFNSRRALLGHDSLRIGMPDVEYYEVLIQEYLPQAELVILDSPRSFLRGEEEGLDAFLFAAEAGSAWTLVYPDYSVAVPKPDILTIPMGFGVRRDDREWLDYLNTWLRLKQEDHTTDELYDRWILGREARAGGPRWCVIRDVLGWVE
jgi:ABC-type amino acid transport substrate-binding protein